MLNKFKMTNILGEIQEVGLSFGKYSFGDTMAIELFDARDYTPYSRVTVNIPGVELKDDEIIVKNYSENAGTLAFLLENELVEKEYRSFQINNYGNSECCICTITNKLKELAASEPME